MRLPETPCDCLNYSGTSLRMAPPYDSYRLTVFRCERRVMSVSYVPLSTLLPTTSRATRYRLRKAGKIRKPDLVINGREYYREDRALEQPADEVGKTQDQA